MAAITKATRECLEVLGALKFHDNTATTTKQINAKENKFGDSAIWRVNYYKQNKQLLNKEKMKWHNLSVKYAQTLWSYLSDP